MNQKPYPSYSDNNIYVDDLRSKNDCFYITRFYEKDLFNYDELELSSEEMEYLYNILKDIYNQNE